MNELLPLLAGQVIIYLIDIINKRVPNSRVRFLIALFLCLLMGVAMNIDKLAVSTIDEVLKTGTLVFSSSQVAYKTYYENSHVQHKLRNPN